MGQETLTFTVSDGCQSGQLELRGVVDPVFDTLTLDEIPHPVDSTQSGLGDLRRRRPDRTDI